MFPRSSRETEVGTRGGELCPPPHGPGRHARAGGEIIERRTRRARRGVGALGNRARSTRPGVTSDGRSLAECTATSARPSSTACCTSFTNTPVPPIAWIGGRRRGRPWSCTITSSASSPKQRRPPARPATGRGAPRVAIRRGRPRTSSAGSPSGAPSVAQVEERAERVGVQLAARGPGRVLQPDGRLVEQLVHDAARERLDRGRVPGPIEPVELRPERSSSAARISLAVSRSR